MAENSDCPVLFSDLNMKKPEVICHRSRFGSDPKQAGLAMTSGFWLFILNPVFVPSRFAAVPLFTLRIN